LTEYHRLEVEMLRALADGRERDIAEVADSLSIPVQSAYYGISLLRDRGLAAVREAHTEDYILTERGRRALEKGLPENQLLDRLTREGEMEVAEALSELDRETASVALGQAKSRGLISIERGVLRPTDRGLREHAEKPLQEALADVDRGKKPDQLDTLLERDLVEGSEKIVRFVSLTKKGRRRSESVSEDERIVDLTPGMIGSGSWKGHEFKPFDIDAPAPRPVIAKKQPYRRFLDRIRRKLISLGFVETTGPLVELSFWNFDALFQAQNHPAREVHDTFKIRKPSHGALPDEKYVGRVKATHEDGWKTGSKGWGYKWSEAEAATLVGRTQGTALSVRALASGIDPPEKYFSIARVFRPDILDRTHLIEFNQCEGIIADENLTFRHLLGVLRMFADEIAHESNFAFVPSYYPFTEPSVDLVAYSEDQEGWVELGGAGIFRQEVTNPFGVHIPVIAWGIGIDRLAMFNLGLNDIRELFSQDLECLRNSEVVI